MAIFQPEFMFFSALWVVPHVLLFYVIKDPRSVTMFVICAALLSTAYLLKPPTGDLQRYSVFITTGYFASHPFDVSSDGLTLDPKDTTGRPYIQAYGTTSGFGWSSLSLAKILPDGPLLPRLSFSGTHRYVTDAPLLAFFVISVIVIIFGLKNLEAFGKDPTQFWSNVLFSIPIILGSVFVLVGSQNSLRQYLGSCFLLLAFSLFYNKRYILALIIVIVATSMHRWMLVLVPIFVFFGVILKLNLINSHWYFARSLNYRMIICSLIFGSVCVVIMKLLVSGLGKELLEPMWSGFYLPNVKAYVMDIGKTPRLERMDSFFKLGLLATILVISELTLGRVKEAAGFSSRGLRLGVFCFVAPFVVYAEIFSRLIYLYFMVEIIYIISCCLAAETRARLAGIVVFLGYGIAPNAMNTLIGSEWLYALG